MNADDFENQLAGRPIREIPPEWRGEILRVARAAAEGPLPVRGTESLAGMLKSKIRAVLWPCPQAWAGLAAMWVVLLWVNFSISSGPSVADLKPTVESPQIIKVLQEQRQMLAGLSEQFDTTLAEPPKAFVPRPRSERRLDEVVV